MLVREHQLDLPQRVLRSGSLAQTEREIARTVVAPVDRFGVDRAPATIQHLEATVDPLAVTAETIESNVVRTGDPDSVEPMIEHIKATRSDGNSVGGIIECVVRNTPPGLGEPVFDKLEAELAKLQTAAAGAMSASGRS